MRCFSLEQHCEDAERNIAINTWRYLSQHARKTDTAPWPGPAIPVFWLYDQASGTAGTCTEPPLHREGYARGGEHREGGRAPQGAGHTLHGHCLTQRRPEGVVGSVATSSILSEFPLQFGTIGTKARSCLLSPHASSIRRRASPVRPSRALSRCHRPQHRGRGLVGLCGECNFCRAGWSPPHQESLHFTSFCRAGWSPS